MDWRILRWGPRSGEGVLLLHGFPQDADTWQPVASALAEAGYNVVAFDQRGSTVATLGRDPKDYNFDTFMQDALAVADRTGLQRFHVVGFGWGGAIAWTLAAKFPDRVRSMVTLRYPHPAAFIDGIQNDPQQSSSWRDVQKEIGPQDIDSRAARLLANDGAGLREFLKNSGLPDWANDRYVARLSQPGVLVGGLSRGRALVPDYFSKVPPVKAPVLYLWSQGPAVSEATVKASANYAQGRFDLIELKGVGHFMIETAPQAVSEPIIKFLHGLDAAGKNAPANANGTNHPEGRN